MTKTETQLDKIWNYLIDEEKGLPAKLRDGYVSKAEFNPVKSLVYGAVALVLIAFFGALIVMSTGWSVRPLASPVSTTR